MPSPRLWQQEFAAGNNFSFCLPASDQPEYNAWGENIETNDNSSNHATDRKIRPGAQRNKGPMSSCDAASPPGRKSVSPDSKTQLIVKYQQETTGLVLDFDDTSSELTLRDMVELPTEMKAELEAKLMDKRGSVDWLEKKDKRSSSRSQIVYAGSFLLKLFLPSILTTLGGGRKKGRIEWNNRQNPERSITYGGRNKKKWKLSACYSFLHRSRRTNSNWEI